MTLCMGPQNIQVHALGTGIGHQWILRALQMYNLEDVFVDSFLGSMMSQEGCLSGI